MPTERFFRLSKEKQEVIRQAAADEFKRVPPELVSINQIVKNADISRGSFYTYFEDKQDLLKWLVEKHVKVHEDAMRSKMLENHGDIWKTLDEILNVTVDRTLPGEFIEIIKNIISSNSFSEFFRCGMEEERVGGKPMTQLTGWLYEHLDQTCCPLDYETFHNLMELWQMCLMISLKKYYWQEMSREQVVSQYKSYIRILRRGAAAEGAAKEGALPSGEETK